MVRVFAAEHTHAVMQRAFYGPYTLIGQHVPIMAVESGQALDAPLGKYVYIDMKLVAYILPRSMELNSVYERFCGAL